MKAMNLFEVPDAELDLVTKAFQDVLRHRQYVLGPEVEKLETLLAEWLRTRYAVGCNSGFGAHLLSLLALNIGPGSKIAVPAFLPAPYLGAIMRRGATPVLIDLSPNDFHINPLALAEKLDDSISAIVVYHLFGGMVDMDAILGKAGTIPIIEVLTYSLGAAHGYSCAGGSATLSVSCLKEETTIGAYGDAGVVWTNLLDLYERLRHIRTEDARTDIHEGYVSGCFNQDTIQAAILLRKFDLWRKNLEERNRLAASLAQAILDQDLPEVTIPDFYRHSATRFVIFAEHRDELINYLQAHEISATPWWPVPLHLQPGFNHLGFRSGDFPEAERAACMSLHLPIPNTEAERDMTVEKIVAFYRK